MAVEANSVVERCAGEYYWELLDFLEDFLERFCGGVGRGVGNVCAFRG